MLLTHETTEKFQLNNFLPSFLNGIGYHHYHVHVAILPDSYNVNSNDFKIEAKNTPMNVLLKGAWAENINSVPYFGYRADFTTNKYLGGMSR